MPASSRTRKAASPRAERSARRWRRALRIIALLRERYPRVRLPLAHRDPFQLLVATILSAQCTDAMVNRVTPVLFERYPTPQALAAARAGCGKDHQTHRVLQAEDEGDHQYEPFAGRAVRPACAVDDGG